MPKQQTINNPITLSGIGLHSGANVNMTLKPAAADTGICFVRTDLPGRAAIKVSLSSAVMDTKVIRCSAVEYQGARVYTIEHLMAALMGLGIDNLTIEIDAEEVPGMDGSSLEFVKALQEAGISQQSADKNIFIIQEPIVVANQTSTIVIVPHDKLNISYTLDYDHPLLRSQFFSLGIDPVSFARDLAPSRTFCIESEVQNIRQQGLGRGSDYKTTLVMSANGVVQNTLRFPDECARHKVLDIVGDLSLLGYPVQGAVYATKSGHALNRALVKKIDAQRQKYATVDLVPTEVPRTRKGV